MKVTNHNNISNTLSHHNSTIPRILKCSNDHCLSLKQLNYINNLYTHFLSKSQTK